jgi:hypothetical protein
MMTTVPALTRSVVAVADGPMARLATSTSSPVTSNSERLRIYPLRDGELCHARAARPQGRGESANDHTL